MLTWRIFTKKKTKYNVKRRWIQWTAIQNCIFHSTCRIRWNENSTKSLLQGHWKWKLAPESLSFFELQSEISPPSHRSKRELSMSVGRMDLTDCFHFFIFGVSHPKCALRTSTNCVRRALVRIRTQDYGHSLGFSSSSFSSLSLELTQIVNDNHSVWNWQKKIMASIIQFRIDRNRERRFSFHVRWITITSNSCPSVLKVFVWMSHQVRHDVQQHHIPVKKKSPPTFESSSEKRRSWCDKYPLSSRIYFRYRW
jgi:hypothetical protein